MNMYGITTKLVGPIQPTGEHHTDTGRLGNLVEHTELVDMLIGDLRAVACNRTRPEASMQAIGTMAHCYLEDLFNSLATDTELNLTL